VAAMHVRAGAVHVPFQLQVLDVTADEVLQVAAFFDDTLFARYGLQSSL
jgi:RNA polymerase sigma-70 factor (ECF subfamily)